MKRRLAVAGAPLARAYVRHARGTFGKTVLARRFLEPALRAEPRSFRTRSRDGLVITGTTADMIQRYLYTFGVWEPNLTEWFKTSALAGRTVVDVGANIGYFSLLASRLVGADGGVVAIEAFPASFGRLVAMVEANDAGNVRCLNVAATAYPGMVALFGGQVHNSGTTSTVAAPELRPVGSVRGEPLSKLLTPKEVRTAKIVKIDVEGGEADVLEGLLPVLPSMPDDVELVIEVTPGPDIEAAVFSTLTQLGFRPFLLENDYTLRAYARSEPYKAPTPLRGTLVERSDVVFSRHRHGASP